LEFFESKGMEKDPRALNAIGYIYYVAPNVFEKDPALLNFFGNIRKDLQKAYASFKKAAHYGSINAKYNIGSLYLTGETIPKSSVGEKVEFSFTQAYDYFRQAAEKGHTLAAYNIALMHFAGMGTY
jgi:TPR repeat protein